MDANLYLLRPEKCHVTLFALILLSRVNFQNMTSI